MKRKFAACILVLALSVSLAACGSSDSASTSTTEEADESWTKWGAKGYTSDIDASDYVELCDYTAIPVTSTKTEVTDDYVDMYIDYQLSSSQELQEVTDRDTVQDGDVVNIDYVGTLDGEEFDGGSATGYDLTIGSGTFIDGFEDGLIGHKVGETVELNLTFPDDYSSEDLAGQDVVFTVTINSIQEYVTPELTDDWVASQGIDGVDTVDEYKTYMKDQLEQQAQDSYDNSVRTEITDYLLANCTFTQDPPTEMVDRIAASLTDTYSQYASYYGMSLSDFMEMYSSYYNSDEEDTESTEESTESTEATTEASIEATTESTEATTEASTEAATESTEAATEASTEASTEATTESTEATTEASTEATTESTEASTETTTESTEATTESTDTTEATTEESTYDYESDIRDMATDQAKILIALQAIADEQDLNITRKEYKTEASLEASSLGYSSIDEFEDNEDEEAYRETMMADNVLTWMEENCIVEESSDSASTESTEATTESTEASTEAATESTEATTEATTASTEAATTESTEASTESSTEASTEAATEAATESSTESSTEASTEADTQ